jgi:hypothetical protein
VEEEIHEVRARLFTGEDGIGGVVVKPLLPSSSETWAGVEDVGVRPKTSAVRAVGTVLQLGSEGRRVVCRKAGSRDHLKGRTL